MKSKRYPNLYHDDKSPYWQFQKYSKLKRKQFEVSTKIPKNESDAARAYKIGVEKFNDWLGHYLPTGREILIRDIGRALKAAKGSRKPRTQDTFANQIDNHVLPAFGHFAPREITSTIWEIYDATERKKGKRKKMGNTLRVLKEILRVAHDEGLIKRIPKLKNMDAPPAGPRFLDHKTYALIRRTLPKPVKTLAFIMYHQGPRPGEAMQYSYSMVKWEPEPSIIIPGEITKTARARTIPLNSRVARYLKAEKARVATDWIMPSKRTDGPITGYNAVWDRAMAKLKLNYTIYNLRDTFITNCLARGSSSVFIGKYCDTSSEMIDKKYAVPTQDIMKRVAG